MWLLSVYLYLNKKTFILVKYIICLIQQILLQSKKDKWMFCINLTINCKIYDCVSDNVFHNFCKLFYCFYYSDHVYLYNLFDSIHFLFLFLNFNCLISISCCLNCIYKHSVPISILCTLDFFYLTYLNITYCIFLSFVHLFHLKFTIILSGYTQ